MQKYGGDQKDDMLTPSLDINKLHKTENRCNRRAKYHGNHHERYDNVARRPRHLSPRSASPSQSRRSLLIFGSHLNHAA